MRVLWLVREDLERHPGGDTTQILRTRAALQRHGVQIEQTHDWPACTAGFDLVHLFHLDRLWENLPHGRIARARRLPLALSPIYWPADEFDRRGRIGWQGLLARTFPGQRYQTLRVLQQFARHAAAGRIRPRWDARLLDFRAAVRFLLETAAVLLPNSRAELEVLEQRFGVRRPAVIVPNAADTDTFTPGPESDEDARSGVICVGRIEPRKNQLALIEALRETGLPLTLVGAAGALYRRYARRCRLAAPASVRFLDWADPPELARLYRSARVHACVSWYETPGLASLEAALCGCRLVVTPGGCTREYFGDQAFYARPDDHDSIRAAIQAACAAPPDRTLAQRVAAEYNWDVAARRTLEGYELALRCGG